MIWTIRVLTGCLVLLSALAAHAQSGKDMLRACKALQREIHREGGVPIQLPAGAEINQCWGFMEAVEQSAVLTDRNGKPLLNVCLSSVTTLPDIVKAFVQYALAHPDKLYQDAAPLAYDALADAFACPEKKSK